MIQTTRLAHDIEVRENGDAPDPDPQTRDRIEELWNLEQTERGHALFNGVLFSIVELGEAVIRGVFVEYRWWIAQRREPDLVPLLRVQPLAVTGISRLGDALLFGRRSEQCVQDPGLWELVPSGGIDASARRADGSIAARAQLLAELEQEVNIPRHCVGQASSLRPAWLVHDAESQVRELAFELQLDVSRAELSEGFASRPQAGPDAEYSALEVVELSRMRSFVADSRDTLSPISRELLRASGWIESAADASG